MKVLIQLSFLMLLLVGPGCKHKKTTVVQKHSSFALQESIARLSDLPDSPIGFRVKKIEKDYLNSDNVRIEYQTKKKESLQVQDIKNFYCCNMELLGWDLVAQFQGEELLLLFDRPRGKKCLISLRSDGYLIVSLLSKKRDL